MPVTAAAAGDSEDDLAGILENVGKQWQSTRRQKLVRSPETRRFLDIGLTIFQQDQLAHSGPTPDDREGTRLLQGISRQRILDLAAAEDGETVGITDGRFRDRWPYKSLYTEDLIAYAFRLAPYLSHINEMREAARRFCATLTFPQLVEALVDAELTACLEDPLLASQTVLQVALPSHPRVQEFVRQQYAVLLPGWAEIYSEIASFYGIILQPRLSWSDVAILFNTVIDGALIRARSLGQMATISDGTNVLLAAITAILPSVVEGPLPD